MRASLACLVLLVIVAATCAFAQGTKDYVDPTGAFAIRIPTDWTANRIQLGDTGFNTELKGQKERSAGVMQFPAATGTASAKLEDVGNLLINAVLSDLGQNGTVLSQQISAAKFLGRDAVRCDIKYKANDGGPEVGYMVVVLGQKNAFLAYASTPEGDAEGLKQGDDILATLAIEATTPGSGAAAGDTGKGGQCLLTTSALSSAAQKIKGGLKREDADKVLVDGNPALTYASVVNFVELIRFVFDVQLTETEFDIVLKQFIEAYKRSDDAGKQLLAKGGASILSQNSKDPAELAKQKENLHGIMSEKLASQAQRGIPYAVALWQAIARRNNKLASVQTQEKPAFAQKAGMKTEMTEADLEAALEMLYFMWVASGRDPNLVTQEAVVTIRAALIQNFAAFPPQVQYILANAQQVYAGLRGQWERADDATKAQLAIGYGQTLDSLGLTVPRPGGGGGGAWSDVKAEDMSTIRAEAMANSAFLSTNSWYNTSH